MFKPLKKKRYSDQIADLVQDRIFTQGLEIGTNLPTEQELAAEFQVSRSVVREALRILEISGLVKIKKGPSGGIFVSNRYHEPIRKSLKNMVASGEVNIDHLFDVRLTIEPHIAGEAARQAKDEDLKKLDDVIKDCKRHRNDPVYLKKNNLDFHLLLAKASGNPVFSVLLESVFDLLIERSLDFIDLSLEKHCYQAHEKILEVIAQKKSDEAERLMREDIQDVREKLKAHKKFEEPFFEG